MQFFPVLTVFLTYQDFNRLEAGLIEVAQGISTSLIGPLQRDEDQRSDWSAFFSEAFLRNTAISFTPLDYSFRLRYQVNTFQPLSNSLADFEDTLIKSRI